MSGQIDDVRPLVSERRLPAKAVVGEVIPVTALVWREGHDAISASLNVRAPGDAGPRVLPMPRARDNVARVPAVFPADEPGSWTFRVDAWSDPVATWRNAVTKKF